MIKHDMPSKVFSNILDEVFNNSVHDFLGANIVTKRPPVNIYDTDSGYALELAAPGLAKDSFDISVKDQELTISANVDMGDVDTSNLLRKEFDFAKFTRTFALSDEVDTDAITANYTDGVLYVSMGKKNVPEAEVIKKIEIA